MTELVLLEQVSSVSVITLNRPSTLNAVNPALVDALNTALAAADNDDETNVIVLRGAGDAFCSGNDLKDTAQNVDVLADADRVRAATEDLQDVTRKILGSRKIVIAAVHGWAVGAGFEWVINCDFSVWGESAKGFFPEVGWGLASTGGVLSLLPKIVGLTRAREMLLLGRKYPAAKLHELGIANAVVADVDVEAEAFALAEEIAALPAANVQRFKEGLARAAFGNPENAMAIETDMLVDAVGDAEMLSRVQGFQETD